MKILIAGGIGQIGNELSRGLVNAGHEVVILSRRPRPSLGRVVLWDGKNPGDWMREVDGAEVLINLAGQSVNCRYHAKNRSILKSSRIDSTRILGEAIAQAVHPPRVWLQSSTATIYPHRFDAPNDDLTGILGGSELDLPDTWRFSYDVAHSWEKACLDAPAAHTRKVLLRTAMVMNREPGGTFSLLRRLTRLGLGGSIAGGQQFMSWVHGQDFFRAVQFIIDHDELSGPVNIASPNPLPHAEFMRALRGACRVPIGLPATRWMVEIGVFLMRSESELILKSRRVVPRRLLDAGFHFNFSTWPEAANDLCRRVGV